MGNCFGKQSANFQGEGRTLGAEPANAPAKSNTASASVPPKISAGRTVGGSTEQQSSQTPKRAAARAAEERVKASQGQGKLGKQLDAQKAQTQNQSLVQSARDNAAAREADAAAQARNYN